MCSVITIYLFILGGGCVLICFEGIGLFVAGLQAQSSEGRIGSFHCHLSDRAGNLISHSLEYIFMLFGFH